ncbi:hypothetical protein [Flagellimonas onchidii]|uniref:hypothetical protein n=1 Tax=Flagellimonas onchidii TaxID=2562684 RepID=UPI0010A5EAF5|nr:hypothetical protein [Allomuricauda onchidii]
MRKAIMYFAMVLLLSCAGEVRAPMNDMVDYEEVVRQISIEELALQKLKDHIELFKIKDDYPEFGDSLSLSADSLAHEGFFNSKTILDLSEVIVEQIGEKEKVSDSLERVKFLVNVGSGDGVLKDSVVVYIKTSEIFIDGKPIVSRDFIFKRD